MPVEMLKEYIGEKVTVYLYGELGGFEATILAVEDNWIKLEEKKCIRIVNGDSITSIRILK